MIAARGPRILREALRGSPRRGNLAAIMKRFLAGTLLALAAVARGAEPAPPVNASLATRMDAMVKAYLDWRPSGGVALGLHEYDGKSPDLSAASVQKEAARLRADLEVLDTALDPKRA